MWTVSDFEQVADLVEEGEVPFMSIRLVACIGTDGTPTWHAAVGGDTRVVPILGHIELLKLWVSKDIRFDSDDADGY